VFGHSSSEIGNVHAVTRVSVSTVPSSAPTIDPSRNGGPSRNEGPFGKRHLGKRKLVSQLPLDKRLLDKWHLGKRELLSQLPLSQWHFGKRELLSQLPLSQWHFGKRELLSQLPLSQWHLGKRLLSEGTLSTRHLGSWELGEREPRGATECA